MHLGHRFSDGRASGDHLQDAKFRHCVLSICLSFTPDDPQAPPQPPPVATEHAKSKLASVAVPTEVPKPTSLDLPVLSTVHAPSLTASTPKPEIPLEAASAKLTTMKLRKKPKHGNMKKKKTHCHRRVELGHGEGGSHKTASFWFWRMATYPCYWDFLCCWIIFSLQLLAQVRIIAINITLTTVFATRSVATTSAAA